MISIKYLPPRGFWSAISLRLSSLVCLCFVFSIPEIAARTLDIRDYGAVANDGMSDADAINAAIIDAGSGDTVYLPGGTWNVDAQIVMKSQMRLRGDGMDVSILKAAPMFVQMATPPFGQMAAVVNVSGIFDFKLSDFTINGNKGYTEFERGVYMNSASDFEISSLKITEFDSIYSSPCFGIYAIDIRDGLIAGCVMEDIGYSEIQSAAIQILGNSAISRRIVVRDNTISRTGKRGIGFARGVHDSVIMNNTISSTGGAYLDVHYGSLGVELFNDNVNCIVQGNTMEHWLSLDNSDLVAIRDNRVVHSGYSRGDLNAGDFENAGYLGIELAAGCNFVSVNGNYVGKGTGTGFSSSNRYDKQYNLIYDNCFEEAEQFAISLNAQSVEDPSSIGNFYFRDNQFKNNGLLIPEGGHAVQSGIYRQLDGSIKGVVFEGNDFLNNVSESRLFLMNSPPDSGEDAEDYEFYGNNFTGNEGDLFDAPFDNSNNSNYISNLNWGSNGVDDSTSGLPLTRGRYAAGFNRPALSVSANGLPLNDSITGSVGAFVDFTSSMGESSVIEEILWDFGDGYLSTELNPRKIYRKAGEYEIVVVAWRSSDGSPAFHSATVNIVDHVNGENPEIGLVDSLDGVSETILVNQPADLNNLAPVWVDFEVGDYETLEDDLTVTVLSSSDSDVVAVHDVSIISSGGHRRVAKIDYSPIGITSKQVDIELQVTDKQSKSSVLSFTLDIQKESGPTSTLTSDGDVFEPGQLAGRISGNQPSGQVGDFVNVQLTDSYGNKVSGAAMLDDNLDWSLALNDYEFFSETLVDSSGSNPSLAYLRDGSSIVAFESSGGGIEYLSYDSLGAADSSGSVQVSNTGTAPSVVATSDGGWVVSWTDSGGIALRKYNNNGVGEAIVYADVSSDICSSSKVASTETGGWQVVWSQEAAGSVSIFLRRYDGSGDAEGDPVRVDSGVNGGNYAPSIARLKDGRSVVAWRAFRNAHQVTRFDPSVAPGTAGDEDKGMVTYDLPVGYYIIYRILNEDGTLEAEEREHYSPLSSTDSQNMHLDPVVAALENGAWAIAWRGEDEDGAMNLYVTEFTSEGWESDTLVVNEVRGDIKAESYDIIGLEDGGYWIAFKQKRSLYGQLYGVNSRAQGGNVLLGDEAHYKFNPSAARSSDGGWALAWQLNGASPEVFVARYDPSGVEMGDSVYVGSLVLGDGLNAEVTYRNRSYDFVNESASTEIVFDVERVFGDESIDLPMAISGLNRHGVISLTASSGSKTIDLASELSIDKPLIIEGSAIGLHATGFNRIANISGSGEAVKVLFRDLAFSRDPSNICSVDGGAIYNEGSLVIDGCDFGYCVSTADGGALYAASDSELRVVDCRFHDNKAQNGGAVYFSSGSSVEIDRSSFMRNESSNQGGGVAIVGDLLGSTTLNVWNSLFASNVAIDDGGALFSSDAEVKLTNCTMADNQAVMGSALYSEIGDATEEVGNNSTFLNNCIVWGNVNSGSSDQVMIVDGLSSSKNFSNCLVEDRALEGSRVLSNSDPKFVDTVNGDYRLLGVSPAVDQGKSSFNGSDYDLARGFRISNDYIDLGAYEYQANYVTSDHGDDSSGTLAAVLAAAGAGETITFDYTTMNGETILLDESLAIDKSLRIDASNLPNGLILDGQGSSRVMTIDDGDDAVLSDVELVGLTIYNGYSTLGGGVFNTENLSVENCQFASNYGHSGGGGIYSLNGSSLFVDNSVFSLNRSNLWGGGIICTDVVEASFRNSIFEYNSAEIGEGGGVVLYLCRNVAPLFVNCAFVGNSATEGGGLYVHDCNDVFISTSSMAGNDAVSGSGLSARVGQTEVFLDDSILWGNLVQGVAGHEQYSASSGAAISFNYALVENAAIDSSGNSVVSNADPQFASWPIDTNGTPDRGDDTYDIRLLSHSPAIDAGDPLYNGDLTDLDGNPRVVDGDPTDSDATPIVDLGAYEYQP